MSAEISISAPFGRGSTYYSGRTIDASKLEGDELLGLSRSFPDVDIATGKVNSGLFVSCVLLRNTSGSALLPGKCVRFSTTDPFNASAYAKGNVTFAIVDEYLPSAGVPNNDIFWAVVDGPTTAKFVTVSPAKSDNQLAVMPDASTAGLLNFTSTTPANATEAQNNAAYGHKAFTMTAIANNATSARVCINNNWLGQ